MKLYTEEQVREAIAMGYDWCHQKQIPTDYMIDWFFQSLTSIELPSDEEIEKERLIRAVLPYDWVAFVEGAKWMRDKIQGGKK